MPGLYARQKKRGDLLVRMYIPRDLIERVEAKMVAAPERAVQRRAWRFAFQELVENLLSANEHVQQISVPDELNSDLAVFSLWADLQSAEAKPKRRKKNRR